MKKPILILVCVLGTLLVGAVVLGVLNGLLGGGSWSIGWTDYRYEDGDAYTVGGGTVPYRGVKQIDLDWLEGEVEILICQDQYISLSEEWEENLAESSYLRWAVSGNGETLTVKFRKSEWFFSASLPDKHLTLRIPASMLEELREVKIKTRNVTLSIDGLCVDQLTLEGVNGDVSVKNATLGALGVDWVNGSAFFSLCSTPSQLQIDKVNGDVTLELPQDAAFDLEWERVNGSLTTPFSMTQQGDRYSCGGGGAAFAIDTVNGNLAILVREETGGN